MRTGRNIDSGVNLDTFKEHLHVGYLTTDQTWTGDRTGFKRMNELESLDFARKAVAGISGMSMQRAALS